MESPSKGGTKTGSAEREFRRPSIVSGAERHSTPEAAARLRRARLADRMARYAIAMGGVGVLVAVLAIFVFVGAEAEPLLHPPHVDDARRLEARAPAAALRCDEYRSLVYSLDVAGVLRVVDAEGGAVRHELRLVEPDDGRLVAAASTAAREGPTTFVALTDKGRVCSALVQPIVSYRKDGTRATDAQVDKQPTLDAPGTETATRLAIRTVEAMSGTGVIAVAAGPASAALLRFSVGGEMARVT